MRAVGSVAYLNAEPLIEGLGPVELDVPSALAERFATGVLDAALVPVFDLLCAGRARAVDGVAIACDGPVASVFVESPLTPREWRTVAMDGSSLTSNALLEVLLREHWKSAAVIVPCGRAADARLLIGDPALDFRRANPAARMWDLGEHWKSHTGLPFVFAVWRLADTAPAGLASELREAARAGQSAIPRIANGDPFRLEYLTRNIRYNLGPREKDAIARFAALALKHGLIASDPVLEWV